MIQHILVLGGGSAGFLAAISLKMKIPDLGQRCSVAVSVKEALALVRSPSKKMYR